MVKNITDPYEVRPFVQPPRCSVQVPGSKSITNRALILAALAQPCPDAQHSVLDHALRSDDTEVMVDSLQRLGIAVKADWTSHRMIVPCTPISKWKKHVEFFCGNSGTTIRFLTAMLSLGTGTYLLDGVPRMRERPIGDLIVALQQLNIAIRSEMGTSCPPVVIHANKLPGGIVTIRGETSSQFLSALMMVAPYAQKSLTIQLQGNLVSIPYVQMTLKMMSQWGVSTSLGEPGLESDRAAWWTGRAIEITTQHYVARQYTIEPDASSASYFWAAAAILGGRVTVPGLSTSLQGDVAFRDCLHQMGCRLPDAETVDGGQLHGIEVDMNAISDTVMTLAVVALFAKGPTRITNVAHIRHKETDRLAALATELRKVGAEIKEHPDGLTIHPRPLHGAVLDTYDDHRMAMSLALIGLRVPGIFINNPGCVAKTFPSYWQSLENMRQ